MLDWVASQGLQQPDLFAHSHGGTVGNLATGLGLQLNRLVLLSWPRPRGMVPPDFDRLQRIIDIRVNLGPGDPRRPGTVRTYPRRRRPQRGR